MKRNDGTIALIVTPTGEGGIGVVQVSGLNALEMVANLFKGKKRVDLTKAPSGSLFYGTIQDKEGLIDEVLVSVWRSSESFTGEDLVEINCHGGIMPVRKTLEALLRAGAREGTFEELLDRATLSAQSISQEQEGLGLIQKEALLLLPHAKTKLAVKVLLAQCQSTSVGLYHEVKGLEEEVRRLKGKLMGCDTGGIDFSLLISSLETLVNSSSFGLALTNPLKVTIAGAPNVGKSTLFNALLKEDRALVYHEPGTTRDYVSEYLAIESIPMELIDTAGLRETDGAVPNSGGPGTVEVEQIGIEWARRLHQEADKVILVLDATRPTTQEEVGLIRILDARKVIPVLNKIDLAIMSDKRELKSLFSLPPCEVSALERKGLDGLERMLIKDFLSEIEKGPCRPIVFTHRQRGLLVEALSIVNEFPENITDCFTASEACQKLDQLEKLFCSFLKG